jgi:glycosyltransferase involved in cell wall biosynthesis
MRPPPVIAHVLPWAGGIGGVEVATLRMVQTVEGFRHIFWCRRDAPLVAEYFGAAGEVVRYDALEHSFRHPAAFLRNSWRLARAFRRHGVAVVHCSDLQGAHYAALAGRLAGCRILCHVRNPHEHILRRYHDILRLVHCFIFVSADTWQRFGIRVPPSRGVVIYDGIDLPPLRPQGREELRAELGIPADGLLIGMVARVSPQKDYGTLVRAAIPVTALHPELCFLIVGDHESTELYRQHYGEVKAQLEETGMAGFFLFTGHQHDVSRFLMGMDGFVLSTHFEGLPLAVLEAMAYGLPVIATSVGGIPELVAGGVTGLLFPEKDDAALGRHLLALVENPALRAELGAAGRQRVEQHFTRRHSGDALMRLYARCC